MGTELRPLLLQRHQLDDQLHQLFISMNQLLMSDNSGGWTCAFLAENFALHSDGNTAESLLHQCHFFF